MPLTMSQRNAVTNLTTPFRAMDLHGTKQLDITTGKFRVVDAGLISYWRERHVEPFPEQPENTGSRFARSTPYKTG
jgi:hypothetical protein